MFVRNKSVIYGPLILLFFSFTISKYEHVLHTPVAQTNLIHHYIPTIYLEKKGYIAGDQCLLPRISYF